MTFAALPAQILKDLAAGGPSAAAWSKPKPLTPALSPVTKFDISFLPAPLQAWAEDELKRMPCPPEFFVVNAIAGFGAIIGASIGMAPKAADTWMEFPNLWSATIGDPSTLKTPALKNALAPLKHVEKLARDVYDAEMADYNVNQNQIKAAKSAKSKGQTLPELPKPVERRYMTDDSTMEMVVELTAQNPRGLLVRQDELYSLIARFEKAGHEGERQFYLQCYSCVPGYRSDRIGRGSTYVPMLSVSLAGAIQPTLVQRLLQEMRGGANDGLLQRLQLMVFPDHAPSYELIDQPVDRKALAEVMQIAETLSTWNFLQLVPDNVHPSNGLPFMRFDKAAQQAYYKWYTETMKQADQLDNSMLSEHVRKYSKLVAALSLIFFLIETAHKHGKGAPKSAFSKGVPLKHLKLAIKWSNALMSHAKRAYSMGSNVGRYGAEVLAKKIKAGDLKDGFSARDVQRKEWSRLDTPERVTAAIDELVQLGWLKPGERSGSAKAGRPSGPKYLINPALLPPTP